MVTLESRQTTQEANQALEDKVNRQVAEIMEAAEVEVERGPGAQDPDAGLAVFDALCGCTVLQLRLTILAPPLLFLAPFTGIPRRISGGVLFAPIIPSLVYNGLGNTCPGYRQDCLY